MSRRRPWRAVAYKPGPSRYWFGHTCAKTEEGLARSVERWTALGLTVEVWEVLELPGESGVTADAGALSG